jgi:dephospho-CoA kinase
LKKEVLKIGITGGIGSGKSTVCSVFKSLEIPVYHADERAKYLAATNREIHQQIVKVFGQEAYNPSGYNKKYIASIVFNDGKLLKKLNDIIHPYVSEDFKNWAGQYHEAPYIIEEAAILFESGSNKIMNYVIFVDSPLELRLERVIARDKTSREGILKRINQQWPADKIRQLADWVVNNNNKQLILPQILEMHYQLIKLAFTNE